MKKVFTLILIIALVTSVVGGIPVFAAKEYIGNGGMSNGALPTKWTKQSAASVVEDSDGEYCAQIKSTGSAYISSPRYAVQPGDRVTLEFDLKIVSLTANTGSACVSVAYGKKKSDGTWTTIEDKTNLNFYENRGEWAHYKYDFLIPDNAQGISFLFRLLNGGEIYYDNISLKDTPNKTTLRVAYGDLELDRVPDGVNNLTAKLHYVSESGNAESGNLIFAAYSGNKLAAMEIAPFSTSNSVYSTVNLDLPDDAKDISVKAYLWKNGSNLKPIAEKVLLPEEGRSPVFDRLVTERMRGAYGGSNVFYQDDDGDGKYEVMDRMLEAGINTFIFQMHNSAANGITNVNTNDDSLRKAMRDFSDFVDRTGSMMFIKFNYGSNDPVKMSACENLYHPGKPNSREVVCPLSEDYWQYVMERRMKVVAEFPKIAGVVFDMEMYNGTGTKYNDPCYCDACVANFAKANPSEAANALITTAANSRQEFSKVNNIFTDYENWQASEITRISSKLRENIHKINPDLILAVMPGHNWLKGLEAGLGTERMPVVILEENSYSGNVAGNLKNAAIIKNNNLNALIATGLFPKNDGERISVANFASKVNEAGMIDVGYWIYSIQHLESDLNYYPEVKKGNELLDEKLGLN